jgi:hypothetical protein
VTASGRFCCKSLFKVTNEIFLELLMRPAPRDVRDHIVSQKNDHGPSYWRYGISAIQPSENQLSRDFRNRSIFDLQQNRP